MCSTWIPPQLAHHITSKSQMHKFQSAAGLDVHLTSLSRLHLSCPDQIDQIGTRGTAYYGLSLFMTAFQSPHSSELVIYTKQLSLIPGSHKTTSYNISTFLINHSFIIFQNSTNFNCYESTLYFNIIIF